MKQFLTIMFVCGASFAQTKSTTAAKSATPAKKAAAPARNLLVPSTLKQIAPAVYKAKFTTTQGDCHRPSDASLRPVGRGPFLQPGARQVLRRTRRSSA